MNNISTLIFVTKLHIYNIVFCQLMGNKHKESFLRRNTIVLLGMFYSDHQDLMTLTMIQGSDYSLLT